MLKWSEQSWVSRARGILIKAAGGGVTSFPVELSTSFSKEDEEEFARLVVDWLEKGSVRT